MRIFNTGIEFSFYRAFSSPEVVILSFSTKSNGLWLVSKYAQSLLGSILVTVDSCLLLEITEVAQTSRKSQICGLPGSEPARGRFSWC